MSVRREAALFVCAVQFLTRLPTPPQRDFEPSWVTRSARYFPAVGQMVGAIAAVVLLAAGHVWPQPVAVVLALVAAVLVTGALHEDGLADTADGLFGGATPARRVEIMKDSGIGTYGVLVLILALGLRAAALLALTPATAAWSLIVAAGVGRAAAVAAMRYTRYAAAGRPTRWTPEPGGVRRWEWIVAVLLAAWPLTFLAPGAAAAGFVGATLAGGAVLVLAHRRIGGHTGDILGAVIHTAETAFLLGVAACV